ncbi:hypothetical protein GCM10010294_05760 [Streptomyces griseoloalbus]|nr:hypothetical protein GCM10010294_05760 [Streptomyces griseoloalbus]
MAPVRLAVQPAGRHPHVQVRGVRRQRLQHVEQVQAQDTARLPGHLDVRAPPQARPGGGVGVHECREVRGRGHPAERRVERVADRPVPGGVQGYCLVHEAGRTRGSPQRRP